MIPIEDLYRSARELNDGLLAELGALVPEQDAVLESQLGSQGKHVAAPIPWNSAAAMLLFEIHGDVRRYVSLLEVRLFGRTRFRPGPDEVTAECVSRLPVLIAHGREKHLSGLDLDDPTHALSSWPKRVRVLLGDPRPDDAPPTPVPGGARCPECSGVLVLSPGWRALAENAAATCRTCRGEDDQPLSWPVTRWLGRLQHEELVTEQLARERFGLSSSRLRVWKRRGRIHPYGQDEHGRQTFRTTDIRALLDAADDEQPAGASRSTGGAA